MKKIVYINLDGFSYSYYELAKKLGKTKIFDSFAEDGFLFLDLHSGIVSITNPMQGAILSGAWSNKTHNFYQHYNKETKQIDKHLRRNDAENVATAYLRNNLSAISIHQFMLENTPCLYDVKDRAYFRTETMPSNYNPRLEMLKKIIEQEPLKSKELEFIYDELPDFIAVYIDDLDSLGHNNNPYDSIPIRNKHEERLEDILMRIEQIQAKLFEVVNATKEKGIYDDIIFLVTTDHGMTKFEGKSLIHSLLAQINSIGIKASLVATREQNTEVILLPYNIECSIYYEKELSKEKEEELVKLLKSLDYCDYLNKDILINRFSMDERAPEFLLSAKKPGHFYHRDYDKGVYGAAHDSFDETSQHIFGLLFGNGVAKKGVYTNYAESVDLIPTLAKHVHGVSLKDATGKIHSDFFKWNSILKN